MNTPDDRYYKGILATFRTSDLLTLLTIFGHQEDGAKCKLLNSALDMLVNGPPGLRQLFLSKIHEIHQFKLNEKTLSYNAFKVRPLTNQQQVIPTLRMFPTPLLQYNHQPPSPPSHYSQQPRKYLRWAGLTQISIIRLKKLPFFKVISECFKATIFIGSEKCTLPNFSKGMREVTFEFTFSPHQVNHIIRNRVTSEGKIKFIYQTQIRICRFEARSTEITDYMPLGLHIRINNKFCPLPPKPPLTRPGSEPRHIARPINCTHQLELTPCRPNKITINWLPDGKNYVFSLHLVEQLSAHTLLKNIKKKPARSAVETKNLIIKNLRKNDQDVAIMSFFFSLKCPLSQMRMKIPAKSLKCDHFACFDAKTFILLNEKKPTWVCPICSKPCLYDDIEIQNYFLEVVTNPKLADYHQTVELLSDGTWRICEVNENKNLKTSKKKTIISMSLDDSDDDSIEFKLQMDKGIKESKNLKSSCVDLTNNDEN